MVRSSLYLYGTSGCHLCEQAEALVQPLARQQGWHLELVDISTQDELVERYGIRIPVLGAHDKAGEWCELGWPFDQTQVWLWSSQLNLMCQGS